MISVILKTDNSFSMTGKLHMDDVDDPKHPQQRFKYSPAHQDVAVCCVPNAGRIYPYYVKAMWMKSDDGITATLLGPSKVKTVINNVEVEILEKTNYPFEHRIVFEVQKQQKVEFALRVRVPEWAELN